MNVEPIDIASRIDDEHRPIFAAIPSDRRDWSDIPGTRAKLAELLAAMPQPPLPDGVTLEDRLAPGPSGAPDVPVRLYRPADAPSPAPAFYWIHGGGMVFGDVSGSDPYCAAIAADLNVLVASVEYRLAPEHPFPPRWRTATPGWRGCGTPPASWAWIAAASPSAGAARAAGWPRARRSPPATAASCAPASSCSSTPCSTTATRPAAATPSPTRVPGTARPTSPAGTPTSWAVRAARVSPPTPRPRVPTTSPACPRLRQRGRPRPLRGRGRGLRPRPRRRGRARRVARLSGRVAWIDQLRAAHRPLEALGRRRARRPAPRPAGLKGAIRRRGRGPPAPRPPPPARSAAPRR